MCTKDNAVNLTSNSKRCVSFSHRFVCLICVTLQLSDLNDHVRDLFVWLGLARNSLCSFSTPQLSLSTHVSMILVSVRRWIPKQQHNAIDSVRLCIPTRCTNFANNVLKRDEKMWLLHSQRKGNGSNDEWRNDEFKRGWKEITQAAKTYNRLLKNEQKWPQ